MNTLTLQNLLTDATHAALLGANVLKHYWGRLSDVRDKAYSGDLITEADRQSEDVITAYLRQHYASYAVLGEENGNSGPSGSDFLWVLDPLDGTTNYAHCYPFFAVSLALLYCGTPIVGVVHNPFFQEIFTATKGGGAFLNGKPLHVSSVNTISRSLLASGFPYDRCVNRDNNYTAFCHLTQDSQGVRRDGAASLDLAYVAAGRLDGYWEQGLRPWDIAAGALLVEEAGGKLSSYQQKPFDLFSGEVVATNGHLHTSLCIALEKALSQPL